MKHDHVCIFLIIPMIISYITVSFDLSQFQNFEVNRLQKLTGGKHSVCLRMTILATVLHEKVIDFQRK